MSTIPCAVSLALLLGALGCDPAPEPDHTPEVAARAGLLSGPDVVELQTTLANGDDANVYVPEVPSWLSGVFEDRFPVVVVLQGGLVPADQYSEYASTLAAFGFVVVVPDRVRALPPLFPEPVALSESAAITTSLDQLAVLDADPSSPVYRVADLDTAALAGHSLGGAVGLLTIDGQCTFPLCTPPFELPASVQAAAFFGTNLVDAGVVTDIDSSSVSVALLQGDLDGVAPPAEAETTYQILETPRALIDFEGLNHFGITNDNLVPGAQPDPSPQTVDQQEGIERLALWTALWLRAELRGGPLAQLWLFEIGGSLDGTVTVTSD
ncbi:MAG: alpha/beta hydrolase [Nannocystaceae bacterium]